MLHLVGQQANIITPPQRTEDTLESICRTCLEIYGTHFGIFNHRINNILLADMLENSTSLEIRKEDRFPINICNNCMEKLASAFDFKTMAIKSNIKLYELRQCGKYKNYEESYNNDVEDISIKEEPLIKAEPTTITDFHCKNEGSLEYHAKEEEMDVKIKLEFESLHKKDDLLNHVAETSFISEDPSKTEKCENMKQTTVDPLGNQASKDTMDIIAQLEFESSDEDAGISDDPVGTRWHTEKCRKRIQTTAAAEQNKKQRNYDENHAELLDNPDCKRIISSGLTKQQKMHETVFCTECNKTFSYRHYITVHAYIHTGTAPYKCDKCEKCYPKKYVLKKHMQSHLKTRDFACDVCEKSFFYKRDMQCHKALKHSDERPYKCNLCDKTFKIPTSLRQHARSHVKGRKYICEICGKTFVQFSSLITHRDSHTTKNFVCTTCGKSFINKHRLNAHVVVHTGPKSFACEVCSRTFNRHFHLMQHMLVHTRDTPYHCKICPSNFKHPANLVKHMNIHGKR